MKVFKSYQVTTKEEYDIVKNYGYILILHGGLPHTAISILENEGFDFYWILQHNRLAFRTKEEQVMAFDCLLRNNFAAVNTKNTGQLFDLTPKKFKFPSVSLEFKNQILNQELLKDENTFSPAITL